MGRRVTVRSHPARVGKLREVLDFWSCSTCLHHTTPDQDYFCAVCRRTQRDVEFLPRSPSPASTAPVIDPEAWRRREDAARREANQAVQIALLEARESELHDRMSALAEELERLRLRRTGRYVEFLLMGVRRGDVEFVEEWENVEPPIPPAAAPPPAPVPPLEEAPPPPPLEPPPEERPLAVAPVVSPTAVLAERTLEQVEAEIRKVEDDLAKLADEERALTTRGSPEARRPFVTADYTLYVREVPRKDGGRQLHYFFSQEPPLGAVPVPLPQGYKVVKHPRTDVPSLRRTEREERSTIPPAQSP